MANVTKAQNLFKKYRIAIVSILAFTVAICCIFAFAGNKSAEEYTEPHSSLAAPESIVSENGDIQGFGVYVDGNFVAAVGNKEIATEAFSELLSIRVSSLGINKESQVSFNNNIEYIAAGYAPEAFADKEELLSFLGKKNDYNVSSYITDYTGKLVSAKLSVRSVMTYTETVTLEYNTKKIFTDSLRDGVTKVVSKGYNGEGEETYQLVSIDGIVSERETLSVDVTVAPADEVVRVGTSSNGKEVASIGTFQKPYDGIITSYVGPRWGRTHNGIDIVADGRPCKGDPAYAAADGVVVRADWYGGYGNCVIIDHGDGIQTLYAHFSELSVQVGDVVKAGDEVGKIGSTGNSTGPHLHFEVHVDGEIVNPLIFVDYE